MKRIPTEQAGSVRGDASTIKQMEADTLIDAARSPPAGVTAPKFTAVTDERRGGSAEAGHPMFMLC